MKKTIFAVCMFLVLNSTLSAMDNILYTLAKTSYTSLEKTFTLSNETLFNHSKPIILYQTPTVSGTIEQQTRQALQDITRKLGHHGFSLEDVIQCNIYTTTNNDYKYSERILKDIYPALQRKLNHTVTKLPENCKVAVAIKAYKTKKKKSARL